MCQEVDHEVETIQSQTERIINGQGAERAKSALLRIRAGKL
jgi:hypothetical protein